MLKDCSIRLRNGKRAVVTSIDSRMARVLIIARGKKTEIGTLRNFRSFYEAPEDIGRLLYVATFDRDFVLTPEERIELRSRVIRDSRWSCWLNFFTSPEYTWGLNARHCTFTIRVTRTEGIVNAFEYTLTNRADDSKAFNRVEIVNGEGDFVGDAITRDRKKDIIAAIREKMYVGNYNY